MQVDSTQENRSMVLHFGLQGTHVCIIPTKVPMKELLYQMGAASYALGDSKLQQSKVALTCAVQSHNP